MPDGPVKAGCGLQVVGVNDLGRVGMSARVLSGGADTPARVLSAHTIDLSPV